MTVITVTTVGFQEVHPLSTDGRIFTMFLTILGVGTALYILVGVVTLVIEGELGEAWGVRRMKTKIEALRNHYILCGFGRVGEEIGREFKDRSIPFVVVESNPESIDRAKQRNFLLIQGDATVDATLLDAGIDRARGLLAASDSDSGNTYITLTAKAMNPKVIVVARAGQPGNLDRMRHARRRPCHLTVPDRRQAHGVVGAAADGDGLHRHVNRRTPRSADHSRVRGDVRVRPGGAHTRRSDHQPR